MLSDPNQVIVAAEGLTHPSVHSSCVHHREYPEVRGEGETPEAAAANLAERLSSSLDSAPSNWRREGIRRAIEDVRAFCGRRR